MNCERAMELLTRAERGTTEERRLATVHASACDDCRAALAAVHALSLASLEPVPRPRPGALESAIAAATHQPGVVRAPTRSFWAGIGLGAALAASLAIAIVSFTHGPAILAPNATPQIALALNEQRDVSLSLTTPRALADAEIHIVLSGAIELSGYDGQRELRWRTNLESGPNQLTLPVVATGIGGGQVIVEVLHGDKRRTFLVDVDTHG